MNNILRFLGSLDTIILDNLWSLMRSSAPAHKNLLVRPVAYMLSHRDGDVVSNLHKAPRIRNNILLSASYLMLDTMYV